jgi:hypothetical protein
VTQDGWTVADDLHGMASFDFYPMYVAIGETGVAVLTWGGHGLDGGGWLGFVPDQGWYAAGAQPFPSYAAVTDRGQAVSVAGGYGPDLVSQTMDIATRSVDEVQQVGLSNRNLYSIVPSLERVAIFTKASDNIVHVTWHDPSLGWGTPQPLATSSGNVFAESDEQGNIVALWLETDNTEIWSRVYDRANEEWTQAMLVTTLQAPGWLGGADMAAGNAIACAGISDTTRLFCAIYQPGVGWLQNSIREVASDFTAFVGPGMTIDQDGNALVVWGNEFRHRRYVKGERWLPTVPGDVQVIPYGSAAAIDGSVTVVGFHTNISDEVFPAVLRFESLTCRRPPRTDSNVPIRFRWNFGKGLPVHAIRSAVWALDSRDDLSPEAPNMREIQVEEVPPCPRAGVPRNMQGYPAR